MSGLSCVYRRTSGIYVVRLVVPARLRSALGRGEVHVSTGLRDWNTAKLAALNIQFRWRERFMAMDIEKLATGSPLLSGKGVIPIIEAAAAIGLSVGSLLGELRNAHALIFTQAQHWQGVRVADLNSLDQTYDGSFDLREVEKEGQPDTLKGLVAPFDSTAAVAGLIAEGTATVQVFRLHRGAAFWPNEEISIPLSAWMAQKASVERIRAHLATGILPEDRKASSGPVKPVAENAVLHGPAKHAKVRFSALFELYRNHTQWGEEQARKMVKEAKLFSDLMDNPQLGDIDAEMIQEYARRLARLPDLPPVVRTS